MATALIVGASRGLGRALLDELDLSGFGGRFWHRALVRRAQAWFTTKEKV